MLPSHALHFDASNMNDFIDSEILMQDVVLVLHDCEDDTAHLALRHVSELSLATHSVFLTLSPEQRKQRVYTPWLRDCATVMRKPTQPVLMKASGSTRHMHSTGDNRPHAASFDMRVGGKQCRVLVDTGATISVMHDVFARSLGVPLQRATGGIEGLGGRANAVGRVKAMVKLGGVHMEQAFSVISTTVSGYDVLLGQDFLIPNSGGILFSPTHVRFQVSVGGKTVTTSRPLSSSILAAIKEGGMVMSAQPDTASCVVGRKAGKRLLREARRGNIPVFAICLADVDKPASASGAPELHERIRAVIQKHSGPGGTLCGDVPKGVRTGGDAWMHIRLKPGANPVHVRQYRLTPVEKEELIKRVAEFIERGWIEPSNSPWSASVLFAPKPNGKLRFCVDYRRLNEVTVKDAGPLPLISETLDALQGAHVYSALDLASGYYQIPLDIESRPLTAFPTPRGLYQWTVMPMGLSNAPAVFQTVMNRVGKAHQIWLLSCVS